MVNRDVIFQENDCYHIDYDQDKGKGVIINLDSTTRTTYVPPRQDSRQIIDVPNGEGTSTQPPPQRYPKWVQRNHHMDNILDNDYNRRSTCSHRMNFALMSRVMEIHEPYTFDEANMHVDWRKAKEEEYNSIVKNDT